MGGGAINGSRGTSFRRARLECADYQALPIDAQPADTLVYLDPPYAGCTGYSGPPFDAASFWDTATRWSRAVVVLVSEYACDRPDWVVVHQAPKPVTLGGGDKQTVRTERLFCHASALARHQHLRPPPTSYQTDNPSTAATRQTDSPSTAASHQADTARTAAHTPHQSDPIRA